MYSIKRINVAEGIFLPCFDKTLISEDAFRVENSTIFLGWDSLQIKSKERFFSLEFNGEVKLENYDNLLFFVNIPENMRMDAECTANGEKISLFADACGDSEGPVELKGSVPRGALVSQITMKFTDISGEMDENYITLYWIGVVDSLCEQEIEQLLPKYSEDSWSEYINKEISSLHTRSNVLFSEEEIIKIKKGMDNPLFNDFFENLYKDAEKISLEGPPEKEIREFVPVNSHLYRYTRVRDRGRKSLSARIQILAVAGFLFNRFDWSYLAARLIMCTVKTPCWFEGPQCCMPGSSWHHVCFCEEGTISSISFSLGFLGGVFTDKGLNEIKLAMQKHFKTVLKCCNENGYRKFSNQGMVENSGRMLGDCCFYLMGDESYLDDIDACYNEHADMIRNYINDEGHCVEGISYYSYSVEKSLVLWKAYSNIKKIGLRSIIPDNVIKSVSYIDACMSTISDSGMVMPANNTHSGYFSPLILVFFSELCGWERGRKYTEKRLEEGIFINREIIAVLMLLCYLNENNEPDSEEIKAKYYIYEKSGLGVYEHLNGKFWFMAEGNPRTGHFHSDRGSVVIEAFGKIILADPGITHYGNALSQYMKKENYHNLAHPEGIPMIVQSPIANISADEAGIGCRTIVTLEDFLHPSSAIHYIKEITDGISFSADMHELYGDKVHLANRRGEYRVSSEKAEFTLCDEWKVEAPVRLCINFMSYSPWNITGCCAEADIEGINVRISFNSNSDFRLMTDNTMKDSELKQMYRLRLLTEMSSYHNIVSKGEIFR